MFLSTTCSAIDGVPAISDYFDMGGYSAFIWPAYGATAVTLGMLLLISLRTRRQLREELASLEESGQIRRRPRNGDDDTAPTREEGGHDAETP